MESAVTYVLGGPIAELIFISLWCSDFDITGADQKLTTVFFELYKATLRLCRTSKAVNQQTVGRRLIWGKGTVMENVCLPSSFHKIWIHTYLCVFLDSCCIQCSSTCCLEWRYQIPRGLMVFGEGSLMQKRSV